MEASLGPLLLAALQHLAIRVGTCSEPELHAAIPALPFLLWVLEGYMEPHAKWFSSYDYFVRVVGVVGLCFVAGACIDLARRGLAVLAAGLWVVLRSSVKISLDGPDGDAFLTCRIPVVLVAAFAVLGAIR